jgi:phage-related protein (TIGR01555 family)
MPEKKIDFNEVLRAAKESGKLERMQKRIDNNWSNPANGFGGDKDPMNKMQLAPRGNTSQSFYEALYRADWLAKKIVNAIPEDALREWIDLKSEDNDDIKTMNDALDKFKVRKKLKNAFINSRLYGGSIMVIGAEDGQKVDQPLKEDSIKEIKYITILDRWQVEIKTYFNDPLSDNFGEPETYSLRPLNTHAGQAADPLLSITDSVIHSSRVVRLDGSYLPDNLINQEDGWGDSVLVAVQRALMQYGTSIQSVTVVLQDFITKVLKVENLAELLQNENTSALETRIQFAQSNSSSLGFTLIGPDEDLKKFQTPVTGLDGLVNILIEVVSASSNITRSRLFGQQLGTLAGADATTDAYFDFVKGEQIDNLKDPIERILFLFSKDKSLFSKEIDYSWKFNPLRQASDKEQALINKDMAQADALYFDRNILTGEEIRVNRFSEDGQSLDTNVNNDDWEEFDELDQELNNFQGPDDINTKTDDFSLSIKTGEETVNVEVTTDPEEERKPDLHIHYITRGTMSAPFFFENGDHFHEIYREGRLTVRTGATLPEGLEDGGHIHEMPDGSKTGPKVEPEDQPFMFTDSNKETPEGDG